MTRAAIDREAPEAIGAWQFARFTAHWEEVAANSPFHAERFGALGIGPSDIRSWADLQKLPPLDTKTLLARNLEFPAVPQARLRRILVSGGTTGHPKIGFYADNLHEIIKEWAAVWQGAGLTPEDVVAVLCPIPLASGMLITEFLEEAGCTTLPVGLTTPPEFAARLMRQLGATAIVSQPSTVQHFAEQIRAFDYRPADFGIRKMYLGSEVLTKNSRRGLEAEWGCEIYDTSGSSETGMIGAECPEHDGHHLAVGSAYFEILDQETHAPVTEGVGQLYITTLLNLGLPLIRYDMKDLVRVTSEPCRCGRTTPRIWFRGRADDRLVLKTGVKFFSYQVDAALEPFDAITASYNVIASGDRGQDRIRLVIEANDAAHAEAGLKHRISTAIIGSSVDFSEIHASGLVADPEVEFVPIGSLPRTPRGKILHRFQDRRTATH